MVSWDDIYADGSIHTKPSNEIIQLVPRLKSEGVLEVLDAGCGTGRHSQYLSDQGFNVHGIDVSERAIQIAKDSKKGRPIDYIVGNLSNLKFAPKSMDFILANHSLEYANEEDMKKSFIGLDRTLRDGRPIFARVVSTEHSFYGVGPDDVYGFSHVGFCIKNGLPVHFFDEKELRNLFKDYKIERLEHISHVVDHEKISVPLKEWVLFGYKR